MTKPLANKTSKFEKFYKIKIKTNTVLMEITYVVCSKTCLRWHLSSVLMAPLPHLSVSVVF